MLFLEHFFAHDNSVFTEELSNGKPGLLGNWLAGFWSQFLELLAVEEKCWTGNRKCVLVQFPFLL